MSNKSSMIQWICSGFFLLSALVFGFSWASLCFVSAAVLLAPVAPVRNALKKWKIGTAFLVFLAVLLFCIGAMLAPEIPNEEPPLNQTQEGIEETKETVVDKKSTSSKETEEGNETRETEESKTSAEQAEEKGQTKEPSGENALNQTEPGTKLPSKENDSSEIPPYYGESFAIINDNVPVFSSAELTATAYERYSDLDSLGRCGVAIASCGKEIMPASGEKRGSISSIYPTGWEQAKYDGISGGYLYNRCHLIGWQLSAENANRKNLITGTRSFNVDGMLPFENMVADYIKETGNHVAYRISPMYQGNNLIASGVRMEAYSIEDQGDGICFHVFVYNVQPGITIDYASGKSYKNNAPSVTTHSPAVTTTKAPTIPPTTTTALPVITQSPQTSTYILNTNTKKIHRTTCRHVSSIKDVNRQSYSGDLNSLYSQGYANCKACF